MQRVDAGGDPTLPSLVLFVTLLVSPLWAQSPSPQVQGRVNDFAQALDASTKTKLNALLVQVYQQTTAEIAVVVVETTAPATPKQYITALFNQWGVGRRGADNGVMILLVLNDRRVEIETGYGVEDILPDGKVGEIIRTAMVPHFKRQQWGEGLLAGSQQIARVLQQDYQAPSVAPGAAPPDTSSPVGFFLTLVVLLGMAFFVLLWLASRRLRCPNCKKRLTRQVRTLQAATYTRPGLREIIDDCPSCGYHDIHMASIPRRVHLPTQRFRSGAWPPGGVIIGGGWSRGSGSSRDSSGGGSSFPNFGGGASGGGGAGASF
jgi:uncharacterized membrane protein YgcG